jgi:hypothetical protein
VKYLLLLHVDESKLAGRTDGDAAASLAEYDALIADLQASGAFVAAQRLKPQAMTARLRDGKPQLTDGPFAEAREQLGGFFLVDVPDRDAAARIALRIPVARYGTVEIREVALAR